MSEMIACRTMSGGTVSIPKEKLSFRPCAYAIIVSAGTVLLTKQRSTGKWWLPGGGIDLGEHVVDALKREAWEECGIGIDVKEVVFSGERFFYYAPEDAAWHMNLQFFRCEPQSFELVVHDLADESFEPRWIPINSLSVSDFQDWGEVILNYLKTV